MFVSLFLRLFLYLFLYLFIPLSHSIILSTLCLFVSLSLCLFVSFPLFYLSHCLILSSLFVSISHSIFSVCLLVFFSLRLFLSFFLCLFDPLSISRSNPTNDNQDKNEEPDKTHCNNNKQQLSHSLLRLPVFLFMFLSF